MLSDKEKELIAHDRHTVEFYQREALQGRIIEWFRGATEQQRASFTAHLEENKK